MDLDVADSIALDQHVDLRDHVVGAPAAQRVGAEWGIDAAERALERTAQAGLQRCIAHAVGRLVEAVPVVASVERHVEQVPGLPGQLVVEIVQQAGRRIVTDRAVGIAVPQTRHGAKIAAVLQCSGETGDGHRTFAPTDVGVGFLAQRALRQRRRVRADDQGRNRPARQLIERLAGLAATRHALRRGRRLLAADHEDGEARREARDPIRGLFVRQAFGLGVQHRHVEPGAADIGGDQAGRDRRLDGSEFV